MIIEGDKNKYELKKRVQINKSSKIEATTNK